MRENYARAVGAYRARAKKASTALIVVIDADMGDVERRTRQLREALPGDPRRGDEAIVHFIPRRHVETWILHLTGEQVDETSDYHHRDVDSLIPDAAANFHQWSTTPPADCLHSITAALQEAARLG